MDRLNQVHLASRVELPKSVVNFDETNVKHERARRLSPAAFRVVGIVGFTACGAAIVAGASLLALYV